MARPKKQNTMNTRLGIRVDDTTAKKLKLISKYDNLSEFVRKSFQVNVIEKLQELYKRGFLTEDEVEENTK